MQGALARLLQLGHVMQISADATLGMQPALRGYSPDTTCVPTSGRSCLKDKRGQRLLPNHTVPYVSPARALLVDALTQATAVADLSITMAAAPERGRAIEMVPGPRDRLAGTPSARVTNEP